MPKLPFKFKVPSARKRWCYYNAFRVLEANPDMPWILVHGVVNPPIGEAAGLDTGHAWAEIIKDGQHWVYDPSLKVCVTAGEYQAFLRVRIGVTYDLERAREKLAETGNYGPWADSVSQCHFAKLVGSKHEVVTVQGLPESGA